MRTLNTALAGERTTAPSTRPDRSPLLSPLWQFTPIRIALAMADSDMPNIWSFSALYWSRSKAIKPQQIVPQAGFIGGLVMDARRVRSREERSSPQSQPHNRQAKTAHPSENAMSGWRDYERPGRRKQQWPDAADVRAGA